MGPTDLEMTERLTHTHTQTHTHTHTHTHSANQTWGGPPMLITIDMSNQTLLFFFLIAAFSVLLLDVSPYSEKYACLFLTHIEVSV